MAEDEDTSVRRQPLPPIDPARDTIHFQQIELDHSVEPVDAEFSREILPLWAHYLDVRAPMVPVITMYGVTEAGNSVLYVLSIASLFAHRSCHVHGFFPYFYVAAPSWFQDAHVCYSLSFLTLVRRLLKGSQCGRALERVCEGRCRASACSRPGERRGCSWRGGAVQGEHHAVPCSPALSPLTPGQPQATIPQDHAYVPLRLSAHPQWPSRSTWVRPAGPWRRAWRSRAALGRWRGLRTSRTSSSTCGSWWIPGSRAAAGSACPPAATGSAAPTPCGRCARWSLRLSSALSPHLSMLAPCPFSRQLEVDIRCSDFEALPAEGDWLKVPDTHGRHIICAYSPNCMLISGCTVSHSELRHRVCGPQGHLPRAGARLGHPDRQHGVATALADHRCCARGSSSLSFATSSPSTPVPRLLAARYRRSLLSLSLFSLSSTCPLREHCTALFAAIP
jgi:hypothetical protein